MERDGNVGLPGYKTRARYVTIWYGRACHEIVWYGWFWLIFRDAFVQGRDAMQCNGMGRFLLVNQFTASCLVIANYINPESESLV